jgi:hypothetical protein
LSGTGLCGGDRDTKNGVSTELALVGRAIGLDEKLINGRLVSDANVGLDQGGTEDLVDVLDRLGDA